MVALSFSTTCDCVSSYDVICLLLNVGGCDGGWVSFLFTQVPSINQLKQSPFPVTLNQDPWAPVSSTQTNQVSQDVRP